ncbi:MAG: WD domain-containing protein, G-beta repeat-containing protein [Glomeribacter sp. 1016415]|nr:WD domain-containing protein, G-beta repeat-containing protein [Glomeribacter sp. 1016415]
MLTPISNSAITHYPATQKSLLPSLASLPVWLPPEIREIIEKQLDLADWQNFFKALTIVTRNGEPIDSPTLKVHLLQQKVPTDYQYDVARSDKSLQVFALNQLKILWKSGQLAQVVEKPALFELLKLVGDPALFRFLQERIEEDAELEHKLLSWVERSKTEEVQTIAANALMLLVKADVDMSGQDFKGIRVPGADLSGGQFDQAEFEGADLSHVNFRRARLRRANLQRANLASVNFGELPVININRYSEKNCSYSPDGCWLAAQMLDHKINLYRTETAELVCTFEGGSGEYFDSMVFSPDSKVLAALRWWTDPGLWRVGSGEVWHLLEGHREHVRSLAFSPNGKILASGSMDQTVRLWEVDSGKERHVLIGHTDKVNSVRFSPNGELLASGSKDGTVKLWRVESGDVFHTLYQDPPDSPSYGRSRIVSVRFSPNGEFVAAGNRDTKVKLWKVESGENLHTFDAFGYRVEFSPNNEFLAIFVGWGGNWQGALFSVEGGKVWKTLEGHLSNASRWKFSPDSSMKFSPDSKLLASNGRDGTVKLSSVESGQLLRTFKEGGGKITWVNFSPDGKVLMWKASNIVRQQKVDSPKAGAYWGPSQKKLKATNVSVEGARGLTLMDKLLLKQKGANGEPAPV